MMKQLIYKDWVLSRKYYLTVMIYCLIVASIFLMIRISAGCGNLAKNEEMRLSLERNMYILRYIPCMALIISFTENQTIYKEKDSGFMCFFRTTAVKEESFIAAKLLFQFIIMSSVFVISVLYNVFLCIADGSPLTLHILSIIASIYLLFMGLSFIDIITYFAFIKRQTILMIKTAVISVLYLVWGIVTFTRLDKLSESADFDIFDFFRTEYRGILNYLFPFALIFAVIAAVLSYFLSVRLMKRRES